jgi:hypothetical protein
MNSVSFNSNMCAKNNNQVNFKGRLGDKFVNDIISGKVVNTEEVMSAVKGTFGAKTDKVADVIESLLGKVQVLYKQTTNDAIELSNANKQLHEVPRKMAEAVSESERKTAQNLSEHYSKILAEKDEELAKAKEIATKYEPMAKVKSIEELGIVMPEKVIETASDMIEHKIEAISSMNDYLFTGKGQEKALEQIERNNIMLNGKDNGTNEIPDVKEAIKKMEDNGVLYSSSLGFGRNLITGALRGNPKGSYLESQPIREQVRQNAISLLSAISTKGTNNSEENISRLVDEAIADARGFHKNLANGKEKLKKHFPGGISEDIYVPFDNKKSHVVVNGKRGPEEISYDDLYIQGSSNW